MFSVLSGPHSVYRGGVHVTITHDTLDLTARAPTLLVTAGGHHWRPPPTLHPSGETTKSRTVCKQAVCILLECFLV